MPKARIEYDLPDESWQYKCANNGTSLFCILTDIDNYLRGKLKYGHEYKSADDALEDVREELWKLMVEEGVNLDE